MFGFGHWPVLPVMMNARISRFSALLHRVGGQRSTTLTM
jgi:hypothetical protein